MKLPLEKSGDVDILSHPPFQEKEGAYDTAQILSSQVAAGFPTNSGESDFEPLDLNAFFVKKPHATFFLRVRGESMIGAGIFEGDLLIVERGKAPQENAIVIVAIQEEMMVKRFVKEKGQFFFKAENPSFTKIPVKEEMEIWGVVTGVLRKI